MLVFLLAHAALAWTPELADAVATGDCATVLAAPIDGPESRLAHGHCLLRTERAAQAAEVLAPLTEGVLGEYARARRAAALFEVGQAAQATAVAAGLELPGDEGLALRLVRAKAQAASGDYDSARTALNGLFGTSLGGEARLALAEAADGVGRAGPAIGVWRTAWSTNVKGDVDDRAAAALAARGKPVTDLADAETLAAAKERVKALKAAHQHGEARELMDAVEVVAPGTWGPVTRAFAAFRGRDYPEATSRFRAVLGAPEAALRLYTSCQIKQVQQALGTANEAYQNFSAQLSSQVNEAVANVHSLRDEVYAWGERFVE